MRSLAIISLHEINVADAHGCAVDCVAASPRYSEIGGIRHRCLRHLDSRFRNDDDCLGIPRNLFLDSTFDLDHLPLADQIRWGFKLFTNTYNEVPSISEQVEVQRHLHRFDSTVRHYFHSN